MGSWPCLGVLITMSKCLPCLSRDSLQVLGWLLVLAHDCVWEVVATVSLCLVSKGVIGSWGKLRETESQAGPRSHTKPCPQHTLDTPNNNTYVCPHHTLATMAGACKHKPPSQPLVRGKSLKARLEPLGFLGSHGQRLSAVLPFWQHSYHNYRS
jgi:hypothetical protein